MDTLGVGGAERQAILCVAELRKLGHTVDLIYYHPSVGYTAMLECLRITPLYVHGTTFFSRCRRLRSLFRERGYDVVHGFKMASEVYTAVSATWAGVPYRFGSFRNIYNLGIHYRLLHHLVDKFLDGWIVNSRAGATSLALHAHIPRKKVMVLRNGLCAEMLSTGLQPKEAKVNLGISADSIVVTMIARLEPPKNHLLLLNAAKRLIAQAPKVRFLVVGNGSLRTVLENYNSAQGLSERVLFLGHRPDIAEILAATDISVLTSNYEGMPNAIMESMAAGKPIVASKYPGYEELLAHESNALISPSGDADFLAKNLLRLIRDPSLCKRLGSAGSQYAQTHFSSHAMGKALEHIYSCFIANEAKGNRQCTDRR